MKNETKVCFWYFITTKELFQNINSNETNFQYSLTIIDKRETLQRKIFLMTYTFN